MSDTSDPASAARGASPDGAQPDSAGAAPGYGAPGYDAPGGYSPPPGYGYSAGYAPPGYGYAPPPGYGHSEGYAPPGYAPAGYGPPPGYGPPGYAAGYPYPSYAVVETSGSAVAVHVLSIFFGFWAALIGYFVIRDRGPFSRQHAAAALNWQLSLIIYCVGLGVLMLVMVLLLTYFAIFLGILVWLAFAALGVLNLVFCIIAATRANRWLPYRYPLSLKLIS